MATPKKTDDPDKTTHKPSAPDKQGDKEKAPDMSPSVANPPGPITPEHESGTEATREAERKAREPQE